MKRLIDWYLDRCKQSAPTHRKVRRLVARTNGLMIGVMGFAIAYIIFFERPDPPTGWLLVANLAFCLLVSAVGFFFFFLSFKMPE